MPFDEWEDMLPHSVTVEPFASVNAYGAYTYGTAVTHKARVQGKATIVTRTNGEEVVSHVTVYLASASVGPKDRLTLPAPFSPTQPGILDVQYVSDDTGHHHTVVLC